MHKIAKYNKIGVAAGASTPECVIKEVIATMSENITEMNMMDLMDDIEKSLRLPRIGETVNGKVHQVTDKEIIVNMGCKKRRSDSERRSNIGRRPEADRFIQRGAMKSRRKLSRQMTVTA